MKNRHIRWTRLVCTAAALVLLLTMSIMPAAGAESPQPRETYMRSFDASLTISGGTARCWAKLVPLTDDTVYLTITLYQKNESGGWSYVDSWATASSGGNTAELSATASVGSGEFWMQARGNIGNMYRPVLDKFANN